jgi:dTDP-4-amino-4,6-dideoxygalactose transaminase
MSDRRAASLAGPGHVEPRPYLPFHRPSIEESDVEAVARALRSGWLTHGPLCREFEAEFARRVGAERAVAVSSGTAALHLSLVALGVGEGDEVVTTPFTFCSTAHVVEHVGATPVFVDVEPTTLQIDPAGVERAITRRTAAILPVHYGGHPCDIERLLKAAADAGGIPVVDDAAHALGAAVGDRPIGSFGAASAFSFYATKNVTTGEGGMVTTDDHSLADRLESLRLHGIQRDAWKRYRQGGSWFYEVSESGFKANMTDIQAALGLSQLAREPAMRTRRTAIAGRYTEAFAALGDHLDTPVVAEGVRSAWHLYPLRLRAEALGIGRDGFVEELEARGVGTSVHFMPLHLHPHFRDRYGCSGGDFPNAERAFERLISLPLYPAMSDADVAHVIACVEEVVREHAR